MMIQGGCNNNINQVTPHIYIYIDIINIYIVKPYYLVAIQFIYLLIIELTMAPFPCVLIQKMIL